MRKIVISVWFLIIGICFPVEKLWSKSLEIETVSKTQNQKPLRIATRYALTTYYQSPTGKFQGLEYDLIKQFTQFLGREVQIIVVSDVRQLLSLVENHQVDFAVGLAINEQPSIRFGPAYQTVKQQVIYRYNQSSPPKKLAHFNQDHLLHVVAGSRQVQLLAKTKESYTKLRWKAVTGVEVADLLKHVWQENIQYALVNANEMIQVQRFYPELRVGFEFPTAQKLAWAFPATQKDKSLYTATQAFFDQLHQSGELARLIERHYGHLNARDFDYVDTNRFYRYVRERLPIYRHYFKQVAKDCGIDWRLLAAIGYQESHWNPNAVSGTGVKGIMMLTRTTAKEMGIKNRLDPFQSIDGGAKYLVMLKKRLDDEIPEPDKTWLALAAYNVGLGHLRDAQEIVRQQRKSTNYWVNVEKTLLLLNKPRWYKKTQYGRARGYEAVTFVRNVRWFYDLLLQIEGEKKQIVKKILPIWSEHYFANAYQHVHVPITPRYVVKTDLPFLLD